MPFVILIFVFVSCFRTFWFVCALELSTFFLLSLAWGLLSNVWTILTVFFFMWDFLISFGAPFKAFITTSPLGEYGTFCHLLTFGVTFSTWKSLFS